MIEIDVVLDKKGLGDFAALKGRMRIAVAVALTKVAKDSQTALKGEAGSKFHLRRDWVPKGIRIDPATNGRLSAKVGSVDKYMGRHVSGDPKVAEKALTIGSSRGKDGRLATGGLLIVPYAGIGSALIHTAARRKLGRIDGQKKKTFQIVGRGGSVLIVRRTSKKRTPLEVLGVLKGRVAEKPVWNMESTVAGVVGARFGDHLEASLAVGRAMGGRP